MRHFYPTLSVPSSCIAGVRFPQSGARAPLIVSSVDRLPSPHSAVAPSFVVPPFLADGATIFCHPCNVRAAATAAAAAAVAAAAAAAAPPNDCYGAVSAHYGYVSVCKLYRTFTREQSHD